MEIKKNFINRNFKTLTLKTKEKITESSFALTFLAASLIFILSLLLFNFIFYNVKSDINSHLLYAQRIIDHQEYYPAHFGFYLALTSITTFFNINLVNAGIILLAFSTTSKFVISNWIINSIEFDFTPKIKKKLTLGALALFFCFSIPDPYTLLIYDKYSFGKYNPMVWHNSTTLFVFPFAILLFWVQVKILNSRNPTNISSLIVVCSLIFANVSIKPSFIFAYIPATLLFILIKHRKIWNKNFLLDLIPILFSVILILIQTILIYHFQSGNTYTETSGIGFGDPFKVMLHWIPGSWYLPFGFILSFLLPICIFLLYKKIRLETSFQYAATLTITGIIIGALIYETGPRMYHGNFTWQNVICSYLILLTSFSFMARNILVKQKLNLKDKILMLIFSFHVLAGIFYIIRIIVTKEYS